MTASPPDVSVVIVNYNSGQHLAANLDGFLLPGNPLRTELVVVDCASPIDQTRHLEAARRRGARVIALDHNAGYAGGLNTGLAASSGRIVILANADVMALTQVVPELAACLDANPDVAFVTPRAYCDLGRTFQVPDFRLPTRRAIAAELAGRLSGRVAAWIGMRNTRSRVAYWSATAATEHSSLHGALLATRRETLAAIGGFDPSFPLYYEDTDVFRRASRAGYRLVSLPSPRIVHLVHRSSATVWDQAMAKLAIGRRLYLRRHLGPITAGVDRLAGRAIAAWTGRRPAAPVRPFVELAATASPTFAWRNASDEVVVEVALDPHFIEAVGHLTRGASFVMSEPTWDSLLPGVYYMRALRVAGLSELARWRLLKS
ncbi:MAG: glycosyltransferase family 2 protein [Planctomycetes bacterium]|nr:glycosyltransferase family 2 protein [Planctomycetota bacterium]